MLAITYGFRPATAPTVMAWWGTAGNTMTPNQRRRRAMRFVRGLVPTAYPMMG